MLKADQFAVTDVPRLFISNRLGPTSNLSYRTRCKLLKPEPLLLRRIKLSMHFSLLSAIIKFILPQKSYTAPLAAQIYFVMVPDVTRCSVSRGDQSGKSGFFGRPLMARQLIYNRSWRNWYNVGHLADSVAFCGLKYPWFSVHEMRM